jgi:hypothetical protein
MAHAVCCSWSPSGAALFLRIYWLGRPWRFPHIADDEGVAWLQFRLAAHGLPAGLRLRLAAHGIKTVCSSPGRSTGPISASCSGQGSNQVRLWASYFRAGGYESIFFSGLIEAEKRHSFPVSTGWLF